VECVGDLVAARGHIIAAGDLAVGFEQLDDRQVGARLAIRIGTGGENPPALGRKRTHELIAQAGLADPWLPDHPHDLPPPLPRLFQEAFQGGHLPLTPHESTQRALPMQLQRRPQRPQPDHTVAADLIRLSGAGPLFMRPQLAPTPDEPTHFGRRHDFPRSHMPQEPPRLCQRVSDWQQVCRGVARSAIHQHMTPVDGHTELRIRPPLSRFRHQTPYRQRCLNRPLRRLL
jgi:hypothetical protein